MPDLKNPILMAQIGAAHGIKGEVRVKSFTGDPLALSDYGALTGKDGRKFKITGLRPSKNMLVVKFKGINTRDDAEALNKIELFIERDQLPDDEGDDEFYVADLVGCDVIDGAGTLIGTVMAVPDFGAGSLLEIAPLLEGGGLSSRTWLLEFSNDNVPVVDLDKRSVTVWPPEEVSERHQG